MSNRDKENSCAYVAIIVFVATFNVKGTTMLTNDIDPNSPFYRCVGCGITTTSEDSVCNACRIAHERGLSESKRVNDALKPKK